MLATNHSFMIWNKRGYKFLLTVFMDPKYTLDGSYRARISNRFEVVAGQPALEQVCPSIFATVCDRWSNHRLRKCVSSL